jgi:hypothetical protein
MESSDPRFCTIDRAAAFDSTVDSHAGRSAPVALRTVAPRRVVPSTVALRPAASGRCAAPDKRISFDAGRRLPRSAGRRVRSDEG